MRNWKNGLFPLLTALTVAALALLPLRLSSLEDGKLTGTVHTEPLAADNNFPSKPPELPGRLWLLAQYNSVPDFLTIVGQELEREKLEEVRAQAREELKRLVELGVLPEKSNTYAGEFSGGLLYLRDQRDLSSGAFSYLHTYDKETGESLILYLDGESGRILALELTTELMWELDAPAEDIGKTFLDGLGLAYEAAGASAKGAADFRLTEASVNYVVRKYRDRFQIDLGVDWETADDGFRTAMGYPAAVDADSMQIW